MNYIKSKVSFSTIFHLITKHLHWFHWLELAQSFISNFSGFNQPIMPTSCPRIPLM